MYKSILVVMAAVVPVIALTTIMSTVSTSDILAESKRDRAIKNLDRPDSAGGVNEI
jgi:hypothetical protein